METIAAELAPYLTASFMEAVVKQKDTVHNVMNGVLSSRDTLKKLNFFHSLNMEQINTLLLQ